MTTNDQHHDTPGPIRIDEGVSLLDLRFQGSPSAIGSYLLTGDGDAVLLEIGPGSTRVALEAGLRRAGLTMADISRLIVTHIHLDHAGAAGVLMRDYPHLRLSVHEKAAPFLVSLDRLWNSAGRIYGDMMDALWGETIDVDADRIDGLAHGDVLRVAGAELRAVATPGHAGTHLAFLDERRGILFTGDAAGARMPGSWIVVPTLAPPELDFSSWAESVETMRGLGASRLALTHFGVFDDADRHLSALMPAIEGSMATAGRVLERPEDEAALAEELTREMRQAFEREDGDVELGYAGMQLAMPTYLAAKGLVRVFKKSGRFS
jgi:glyoxylase-like metal-dependent hydrolase (beta-lactamase superfamily II)